MITKDQEIICPVDASGRFTEPVKDFLGQYVKVRFSWFLFWYSVVLILLTNSLNGVGK